MENFSDVIITDSIGGIGTGKYSEYLAHSICLGGSCTFTFNERPFELHEGDLLIVRNGLLVDNVVTSDDFVVKTLYVTAKFVELSTPQTNYGTRGSLSLFMNPVMRLDDQQRFVCERDFRWIEYRLSQKAHTFYRELLINAVQSAILDFFDFHSVLTRNSSITTTNATLMNRFIEMLENRTYREHREVRYYATQLCVTPKYLSELSKKVSGYPANYWINRYTSLDIARLLRDKSLSLIDIADMFDFSSPAYFSRYVQRNLGMNPSEYRE